MLHTVDPDLSARFAKSYSTAAFGYARAASAAYAVFAHQTMDFWTQAASGSRDADPRLTLVTGPRPYRSAYAPVKSDAPMPFDFVRISNAWVASPLFAPARAWWGLFPLEGNPASWPMAYAMMTAGVPRAVAMPTAEANVAALDAADAAQKTIDHAFSNYRSSSGFAVSQIASPKALYSGLFLSPLAAIFKFPWA